MFLFNLCPLPVKGVIDLYAWMRISALRGFPANEVTVLGSAPQLVDPNTVKNEDWVYQLAGDPPDSPTWEACNKIEVPSEMIGRIVDNARDPKILLKEMAITGFQEYTTWLYDTLSRAHRQIPFKAAITFVNDASLEAACRQLNIPVIHMEGGFIRQSSWKISTFQFDFKGVNGNSEAETRFQGTRHLPYTRYSLAEIADKLMSDDLKQFLAVQAKESEFEFGVPLQVDDDSNLIAFANGYTNLDALYTARKIFPPRLILARNHPLSFLKLQAHPNIAVVDDSRTSLEFISRCKRILTINSSVAFEALMMGRATYVLGDSPLKPAAHGQVDRHLRDEILGKSNVAEYLDFITFNYLIPSNLWMNKDYIEFRLGFPSETLIRERHIAAMDEILAQN
jgi:hypothetical protein